MSESAPVVIPRAEVREFAPRVRLPYRLVQWSLRVFGRVYCRMELHHRERVPRGGAILLLPTHTSFLDPPMVGGSLVGRECYYLSRDGILKVPLLGKACSYLNAFPLRRGSADREALRICREILGKGWPLIFFPEGTRSDDGKLGELKPGWAMILDGLENVPYLPVVIQDTYRILNRRMILPRPRKMRIIFGEPAFLPPRREGERARDYYTRCCAELEKQYRALGAI